MVDYTVSAVFDLIAHQRVTHPNSVYGAARTTTDMLYALINIHHGFRQAGANTNPGSFYVQVRLEAKDDQWTTVAQFTTTSATTVTEALTAVEPLGETVLAVASTAGFAANDYIYVDDATADTDDEWHQLDVIVANTSLNLIDGLVAAKAIGDDAFSDAEHFSIRLNLAGVAQYRVIYKHEGAVGMDTAIWVRGIEVTDIG